MHLRAAEVLKRPALFERLSGLSVGEFERVLEAFSREYHQQVIEPRRPCSGSRTCGRRWTKGSSA